MPGSGSATPIPMRRPSAISRAQVVVLLLLLLGAIFYSRGNYRFLMHDDEGNYAYAAWRISLGEVPYRDFLTPQMPVFLYWGSLVVRLFGPSFTALRMATLAVVLLSACLLYALNRAVLGRPVAIVSMGLFLIEPNVFNSARFYLPEAYMLVFQLAGLYAFVLGEQRRRLGYSALAGALMGLSILSKLFGALPLAGCMLYLVYAWWRERRPLKEVWQEALAMGLSALLVAGTVAMVMSAIAPYFHTAVFEHHTMQGAGMSMADRARKALGLYHRYAAEQRLPIVMMACGACLALWRKRPLASLLLWHVPTALAFLPVSRGLDVRHLTYLSPTLATLIAVVLVQLLCVQRRIGGQRPPWPALAAALVPIAVAVLTYAMARPWIARDSSIGDQQEDVSSRIAPLIQSLADSGEQVMADYPGLNFMARRRSTYWAGGISGGATTSGQIGADELIADLEQNDVAVVVINVSVFDPQMARMVDYLHFRHYVEERYAFVDSVEYSQGDGYHVHKTFDVFARIDPVPVQGYLCYGNEIQLQALAVWETAVAAGDRVTVDTRWRAVAGVQHDYHASAMLIDAAGRQWAETHAGLGKFSSAPSPAWPADEVVSTKFRLPLNPAMPPGDYYLVVLPYYSGGGYMQPGGPVEGPAIEGMPVLADIRVLPPSEGAGAATAEPIAEPLEGISFGEHFCLLGYGLSTNELQPGESLSVTLYWAYQQPSPIDYKIFVHLLDGASQVQGQHDAIPRGGGAMTSGWVQGDVLMDLYEVPLALTAEGGTLQIEVGFYDLATGARLPLLRDGQPTGEDRLILPETITAR